MQNTARVSSGELINGAKNKRGGEKEEKQGRGRWMALLFFLFFDERRPQLVATLRNEATAGEQRRRSRFHHVFF